MGPVGGSTDGNIGEGAYGVVYRALDQETQEFVALKRIRFDGVDDGVPPNALREFCILSDLSHPNVVALRDIVLETTRVQLVFELIDMDLKKLMDQHSGPLELTRIVSYTRQMLAGLAFCHAKSVMHRDLKPQNLLVSADGRTLKLADFGLARHFTRAGRALTPEVITRWYRAPEILLGKTSYKCSVDMWSVGCIVAEMANDRAFLQGDSEIDQLHRIFQVLGTPTDEVWPGVQSLPFWRNSFPAWPPKRWERLVPSIGPDGWDFMIAVLTYDPSDRCTAVLALEHPFLNPAPQAATPDTTTTSGLTPLEPHITPDGVSHDEAGRAHSSLQRTARPSFPSSTTTTTSTTSSSFSSSSSTSASSASSSLMISAEKATASSEVPTTRRRSARARATPAGSTQHPAGGDVESRGGRGECGDNDANAAPRQRKRANVLQQQRPGREKAVSRRTDKK